MKDDGTTKTELAAKSPAPQKMRYMYTGLDRAELVSKLTTRVPYQLRTHLKAITAYPLFGYRTQTQMYSVCMIDFIKERPWQKAGGLKWRYSTRADASNPLYHLHLEPQTVTGIKVTGGDLKKRALELAEEAGVNQAAFTLTFLWWVALHKHPIDDPRLMAPLMEARGANPENLPSPVELGRVRAAYLELAKRLSLGMRDIATRTDIDPNTSYNMFESTMPRPAVYQSLQRIMEERLEWMRSVKRQFKSGNEIDGQALNAIRGVLGLSQTEMASVLGYAGAGGKSIVSAIETGVTELRPERTTLLPEMLRARLAEAEEPALWREVFAFLAKPV